MKTFLKLVAHDLYTKTNGDFARTAIVFPNKRAGLFFNEYLASETDRPIWSPVKLVCELYKVFVNITGSKESLDDFYFWGELLISDFDDADKNMVDTEAMFRNIKDLNELSDNGYEFLEEEGSIKPVLQEFLHRQGYRIETTIYQHLGRIGRNIYRIQNRTPRTGHSLRGYDVQRSYRIYGY